MVGFQKSLLQRNELPILGPLSNCWQLPVWLPFATPASSATTRPAHRHCVPVDENNNEARRARPRHRSGGQGYCKVRFRPLKDLTMTT